MTDIKPGFWKSSLSEEQAISASTDYSQLECSGDGVLCWVEQRPDQQGRNIICCYLNGEITELTSEEFSVQSKVHEYGGRSWCLCGNSLVFVNAKDQQLYVQSAHSKEQPLKITETPDSRFIEPVWDAQRRRLIAIEEFHADEIVVNRLVAVDIESGLVTVLHQGNDFYAYPDISDEDDLAFVSWMHPEQPWTSTQLNIARLDEAGLIKDHKVIAGEGGPESISQTCFNGKKLGFISDRSGWWNIFSISPMTEIKNIQKAESDVMPAPWQSGLKSYVYSGEYLIWVEQHHEGAQLFCNGKNLTPQGYTQFRSIAASEENIYCVAAGPARLPQIIAIPKDGGNHRIIAGGKAPMPVEECAQPVAMQFGESYSSYGYLYPATNTRYEFNQPSPLVVFLHGGPTACTYPILNPKIQYWTQRGFSVLDLNYRGSSCYGRSYRMQLQGRWGEVEIEDIEVSINQLISDGLVDPDSIFIRGNSSGGYSALNAMSDLDCFAGGASLYGVTDPLKLTAATHKFESRYLDWLIGDPEREVQKYSELAPVNKADQIDCPVIFFQGEQDRVVVPDQTRLMIQQLQNKGVKTQSVFFPDEAHGFRKRDNQIKVLCDELGFYQEILSEA